MSDDEDLFDMHPARHPGEFVSLNRVTKAWAMETGSRTLLTVSKGNAYLTDAEATRLAIALIQATEGEGDHSRAEGFDDGTVAAVLHWKSENGGGQTGHGIDREEAVRLALALIRAAKEPRVGKGLRPIDLDAEERAAREPK